MTRALHRRYAHAKSDGPRYVVRVEQWRHGTSRPFYWARDVGTITPRISEAWSTQLRSGAENLAGREGGTVEEYTPKPRRRR